MDWLELIKTFGVPMVLAGFLLWQHFKGQAWERSEVVRRETEMRAEFVKRETEERTQVVNRETEERAASVEREAVLSERIKKLETIMDTNVTTTNERMTEALVETHSCLAECKEELRRRN